MKPPALPGVISLVRCALVDFPERTISELIDYSFRSLEET
jgi:hypothetical protein